MVATIVIPNFNGVGFLKDCLDSLRIQSRQDFRVILIDNGSSDGSVEYVEVTGDIVFDGGDVGYSDEKMVLHDIKLYATPGQKIAFVGSTGAGKTTITNLINRFYDIQDGKIRYDGININKIKKADLRRSLGIVLQDTHLFT